MHAQAVKVKVGGIMYPASAVRGTQAGLGSRIGIGVHRWNLCLLLLGPLAASGSPVPATFPQGPNLRPRSPSPRLSSLD